jgi:hypothetical protein
MLLVFMALENARQYDDRISHDDFPFLEVLSQDCSQPQTKLGWGHKQEDQNDKHLKMGQIYFKILGLFPATEGVSRSSRGNDERLRGGGGRTSSGFDRHCHSSQRGDVDGAGKYVQS